VSIAEGSALAAETDGSCCVLRRKRIHDERIKLWTWHVTAIACLVGSVLFVERENDMASPLGNSVLLSVTYGFR